MRKFILTLLFSVSLMGFSFAGTDGENSLSKNSGDVKDCFEKVNRATFAFNKGLDNAIIEPLAKGYRKLPSPIRMGTSNFLSNISNLVTIPNNLLQGDFQSAGTNTVRLAVNSTIGILEYLMLLLSWE